MFQNRVNSRSILYAIFFLSGATGLVVYLVAVTVIASRQHALMVLTHDGIHKRLSRNLWFNDRLARYVAAFPIFISLAKWRFIHLDHHQSTHTLINADCRLQIAD